MDVSLNPLVGLFFACDDDTQAEEDASVLVLDFKASNVKFADSDTISAICNLANLSDQERSAIFKKNIEPKVTVEQFNEIDEMKRLVQFVKSEKPYFLNIVRPQDMRRYYFVHPRKTNRRVIAQSGAFVVAGLVNYTNAENAVSFQMTKIGIRGKDKGNIVSELDKININRRTLFPEIESVSKYIKMRWLEEL